MQSNKILSLSIRTMFGFLFQDDDEEEEEEEIVVVKKAKKPPRKKPAPVVVEPKGRKLPKWMVGSAKRVAKSPQKATKISVMRVGKITLSDN